MGFVQTIKDKAYYKRYQVKYRRRREGKTDYRARLRLCIQDKNKYNTPKYRFVVRCTNTKVICQILYATIKGDVCVESAESTELVKYGIKAGLKNYAACYATGLLLARRVLTKLGLADAYEGNTEAEDAETLGVDYNVEDNDDGPKAFVANLDSGLMRTSTGSRVFAALKGACDGGISIPHNEKRFVGFMDKELDTEMLGNYIVGGHVSEYMEMLQEEEPDKYASHFAKYLENDMTEENLEDIYTGAHEAIREDPSRTVTKKNKPSDKKKWKPVKLTYEERKAALKTRLEALKAEADE